MIVRKAADSRSRRHLVLGLAAIASLSIGGAFAYCEGLHDGWGAALRGLTSACTREYERKWPDWYQNGEDLIVRYPLDVVACGTKTRESRWFRIRRSEMFATGRPPSPDLFEAHDGDLPDAIRAQAKKIPLGVEGASGWPENFTAAFGNCVVAGVNDRRLASDCDGKRTVVQVPELLPYTWKERSWWGYPAMILGFPFALVFDAVTIPLNAALLALFVLPLALPELASHRRLFWKVGLACAVTSDLSALLGMGLSKGHSGAGGLGSLISLASAIVFVLSSAAVPLVAGIVVARDSKRQSFVAVGIAFAAVCLAVLTVLAIAEESVLEPGENLFELLLHPFALIPGLFALGLAGWGARSSAATPSA